MQSLSNFNKNIFFLVGNKYAQVPGEKSNIRGALRKLLEDNKNTQKYKTQKDFVSSPEYEKLIKGTDADFIITLSGIISSYFETPSDGNEEFVEDTLLKENSIFYILLTKLNALVQRKLNHIITKIRVEQESILAFGKKELYDTAIGNVSAEISNVGLFVIDDFFGLIKSPLATYYLQNTDILKQANERIYALAQDFFKEYEGKPFSNLNKQVNPSNRSTQFHLSTISELKESIIEHKMVIILLLEDFIKKVESDNPWAIEFLTAQIRIKINKKVAPTWTGSEEISTELTRSDKIQNRLLKLDMSIISDGSLIKEAMELYEEYYNSLELMKRAAKEKKDILKIIQVLKDSLDQSYHALEERVIGWKNIFDHSASTFREVNQEVLSSLFIGNNLTYIFDSKNGSIEKNPLHFKLELKIDPGTKKLISSSNVIKLSMRNLFNAIDGTLDSKKVQQTTEDAEDIEESEGFIEIFSKIQGIEEDSKEEYIKLFKDFVKNHPSILFMKYLHKGVKQNDKLGKESQDPKGMFKKFSKTNPKEYTLVIDIQEAIKKHIRDNISAMQKSLNLTDDAIHCFNTIGFPSLISKINELDPNDRKYEKYEKFRDILQIIAAGAKDSEWSLMGESEWKIPLYISRALNNIQEHDDMGKVIDKCSKNEIDKIAQDKLDSGKDINLLVIAQYMAKGLSASRTVTNNTGTEAMRQEMIRFFKAHPSFRVIQDLFDKQNKTASRVFFDKTPYSLDIKINEHIKMMARQVYIG